MLTMNKFVFIDDEWEPNSYYIIEWEMEVWKLKEGFKKIYAGLMNEFWNDDFSKWEYWDFYDELNMRLEKVWINLLEPEFLYHSGCF